VFAAQIALLGLVHTANCAVVYTSVGAAAGRVLRARPAAAREAGCRPGSERGSPNHGSTLASKRVMAQIWRVARRRTAHPRSAAIPGNPAGLYQ
jgi:hypothetical protein